MKRILCAVLCLVMLISLMPVSALADDTGSQNVCGLTEGCTLQAGHDGECSAAQALDQPEAEPSPSPDTEAAGEPEPSPEGGPSEAEPTLSFTGCDSVDEDGCGHYIYPTAEGAEVALAVYAESNAALSYAWDIFDPAEYAYVPLDVSEYPTAGSSALVLTVDSGMLDMPELYRCAVTAVSGEQTVTLYAFVTLESVSYTAEEELVSGESSALLFQQGDLPAPPCSTEQGSAVAGMYLAGNDAIAAASAVIKAGLSLENFSSSINLSEYELSLDELKLIISDICNTSPMLFYVDRTIKYSIGSVSQKIYDYKPVYTGTKQEAVEATARVEAEIANILAAVDEGMSTAGKLLAVNDYFTTRYQYDNGKTKFDIYNLFVNKTAVCQAYALGYMEVLHRLEIPCEAVVSDEMNHMWNIVSVDGQWYHVDVTWNDPVPDRFGRANHGYFLVSGAEMEANKGHHDWISNQTATSTRFDEYFWDSITKPFAYVGGSWYYLNSGLRSNAYYTDIYLCSPDAGTSSLIKSISPSNGYSGFGAYDGGLMVNSGSSFYKYDPSTAVLKRIADADIGTDKVYASYVSGNQIIYGVGTSPYSDLTVKNITPAPISAVSVTSGSDSLTAGGYQRMTAVLQPENATVQDIVWSVVNGTGTAEISTDGMLHGLTAGTVTVKATADDGSGLFGSKEITVLSEAQGVLIDSIEVSSAADSVLTGNNMQFTAAVLPLDATNPDVIWSITAGSTFATIDQNGLLTATAPGTVTVKATAMDGSGRSDSKTITVIRKVTGITVSSSGSALIIGSGALPTMQFSAGVVPSDASNKNVEWSVVNGTGTATITAGGLLTAQTPGTVTVKAAAKDGSGITGTKAITITRLVSQITVSAASSELTIGAGAMPTLQMSANVLPADASDKDVVWSVVNGTGTATITAGGLLTAQTPGAVTVKATAKDGSGSYGEKSVALKCDFNFIDNGDGKLTITGYNGQGGDISVPAVIGQKQVVALGSGEAVFASGTSITSLALPAGLTSIGANAFYNCSGFTGELILPDGLESIGSSAFYGCAGLNALVELPDSLQRIDSQAFRSSDIHIFKFMGDAPTVVEAASENASLPANATVIYLSSKTGWDQPKWQGYNARAMYITVGEAARCAVGLTLPLAVSTNLDIRDITWSIVSGSEFADIDAASGELTGLAEGAVTVRAAATDGTGIYDEISVDIVSYGMEITGESSVVSGQKSTFSARFQPENLSDTSVVWSLAPGDEAYAALSASGSTATVTALAVTAARSITLTASSLDGQAAPYDKTIMIVPRATGISIFKDAEDVTNKTVKLDLNSESSFTASALVLPEGASNNLTWTSTDDVNKAYGTLTVNDDGTVDFSELTGRAGTVKLTARANDGSGKTASVTLTLARYAQSLSITAPKDVLRGGESITLTTDIASDSTLTDKTVLWSLDESSLAYASISGAGRLTTKSVPAEMTITVIAAAKANESVAASYEITVKPAVAAVQIYRDSENAGGKTYPAALSGGDISLTAEVQPVDAISDLKWTSSNARVAVVDESGCVTPLAAGTVTIRAASTDGSGKYATVKLVIGTLVEGIEITNDPSENEIRYGKAISLTAKWTNDPSTPPTNRAFVWSLANSADAAYVSLSAAGRVTAKAVYEPVDVVVRVSAKDGGGASTEYTVRVLPAKDDILTLRYNEVNVTKKTLDIDMADEVVIDAYMLGSEEPESITWKSSNVAVAVVNATTNAVIMKKAGTVTLTAVTASGVRKEASVTLKISRHITGIALMSKTGSSVVASGKTLSLGYTLEPTAIKSAALDWRSSDPAIATVSSTGVVKAAAGIMGERTVVITAAAKDGSGVVSEEFEVTVLPITSMIAITHENVHITGLTREIDMGVLPTLELAAISYPSGASNIIAWSSSNTRVATVSEEGVVTGLSAGTVSITAKACDGSGKAAVVKVRVLTHAQTVSVKNAGLLQVASSKRLTLAADFGEVIPTNKAVTWALAPEDAAYAAISASGVLTAKKVTSPRTVTVTVTSKDVTTVMGSAEVMIVPLVSAVSLYRSGQAGILNGKTLVLDAAAEQTLSLRAVCVPDGSSQSVTWSSSNASLVTVDSSGTVALVRSADGSYKSGIVSITARATDGSGRSASVKIQAKTSATEVSIGSKTGAFYVGGTRTLTLVPDFGVLIPTNKSVTWKLAPEDAAYATINSTSGVLTARKVTAQQTVTVTVISKDNPAVTATREITVIPMTTAVNIFRSGLTYKLNGSTLVMYASTNDTLDLDAVCLPADEVKSVAWTSSDPSIAAVNADGTVTAMRYESGRYRTGRVLITAKALDGSGRSASVYIRIAE